jgi:polyhydroxyalkanoate synthesis regulator phasin
MSFRNAKLACLVATVALGVGCGKKSAEDAERDWNKTQENAQKYASKYPAAKAIIDDLSKQAKADFDEAKKADEKSRSDKIQLAVDKLGKPLEAFGTYEAEYAKLDALQHDKDLMGALSAADFNPLDQAASAAKKKGCCILQPTEKSCSDLPGTCAAGPALANMGDLKAKLEGAIADMTAAEKALEAKKPKPAAAPAPAGSAAKPPAPAGSAAPAAPAGSGK